MLTDNAVFLCRELFVGTSSIAPFSELWSRCRWCLDGVVRLRAAATFPTALR
jgi:hypothetical protein